MLTVLILTGCSKKPDNNINEKADGNELNISSVSVPMTFTEEETEFEEDISIKDIMLSENETYVVAASHSMETQKKFKAGYITENTFDNMPGIQLKCSYVYDLCCSEDNYFICYGYQNDNYISVFNKLTGELINSTKTDLYANSFEIEYENGYIMLSYGKIDEDDSMTYAINIYNDSLELTEQNFDISNKLNMKGCMAVSFSKCGEQISAMCFQKENGNVGFIRFSYSNESYEYFPSDININSGFEPVSLCGIDENRILFQYCDRDSDTTYLNIYDWSNKKVTDMYDIKGFEQYIRHSDNDSYMFYSLSSGTVFGYTNSSAEPVKLADESDDYTLIQSFYDYYEKQTVIYNDTDTQKVSVYSADSGNYTLVTEYNFTEYKMSCSLKNGDIAALLTDNRGYRVKITDCSGNLKSEYRLEGLQEKQIEQFLVNENGNAYVIYNDNYFIIEEYNASGIRTNSTDLKNVISVYDMYPDTEEKVNIYVNSYDGNQVISYKYGAVSVNKLNEFMTSNYFESCNHLYGEDMTFQDADGIYSYSFSTGVTEKLFDINAQVLNCSFEKCMIYDKDTFVFAGIDYASGKPAVSILVRGTDENTEKTEINIAEIGTHNNNLRKQFRIYNKNSSEYVIKISGYKSQEDFYMAEGKGFVPDIITYEYDSGFNAERFITSGYAEKLNKYISEDKTLNSDDYFLSLFKTDSSEDIYQIGSGAQIKAMYSEDESIRSESLNVSSFTELAEKYGTEILADVHYTPTYNMILEEMLGCYIENSINYQNDSFDADSDIISELLELAKSYYYKDNSDTNENSDGKISVLDIYDFSHSYNFKNIISFPVTSPKHQIYLFDKMMISSNSQNKNEAWNIIKMILLDEYQNNVSENKLSFPVKKSAFYKMADLRREYEMQHSEQLLEDEHISYIYSALNDSVSYRMPDKMISKTINICFDELISNSCTADDAALKLISAVKKFIKE